jgi:hypothetical protein
MMQYLSIVAPPFSVEPLPAVDALPPDRPFGSPWRRLLALFVNALLLGIVSGVMCIPFFEPLSRLGPWGRLIGFCIALPYFAILRKQNRKWTDPRKAVDAPTGRRRARKHNLSWKVTPSIVTVRDSSLCEWSRVASDANTMDRVFYFVGVDFWAWRLHSLSLAFQSTDATGNS